MKKKILAALLATVMVFSFTACGSKDDGVFVLSEDKLDEYVTLTEDFDIFNVEIDPINVTDDDINVQLNNLIMDKAAGSEKLQKLVNRQVVSGDTVIIDYVGTKDGVAFEGGTSYTSTDLKIGSGSFIPGFEDGLIGTKPGDVVTLDLTFPEDYSSAELAGQEVQFEVTVHYILPTFADVTEDVVADLYDGQSTIKGLREQVSKDIYDSMYASAVEYAVVGLMEEKCTYGENLPEELTPGRCRPKSRNKGRHLQYTMFCRKKKGKYDEKVRIFYFGSCFVPESCGLRHKGCSPGTGE